MSSKDITCLMTPSMRSDRSDPMERQKILGVTVPCAYTGRGRENGVKVGHTEKKGEGKGEGKAMK